MHGKTINKLISQYILNFYSAIEITLTALQEVQEVSIALRNAGTHPLPRVSSNLM